MKRTLLFIALSIWISNLQAQYQTNTLFFGYLQANNTDRDTVYNLKFEDGQTVIEASNTPHSFESSFASISDSNGNLLLYTNGCMIADNTHQIIPNGSGLNPGPMASELCANYGYISDQGTAFVPVPDHPNDFWLIHMAIERDTLLKTKYGPLYATYIDGSNGGYSVTTKNQILLTGNLERFAIVKHGDGKNWWVMVPKYNTNEYHSFLIDQNGIEEQALQTLGPVFHFKFCANGRGANVFSNTGKYYTRNNTSCGPVVFEFDRCTGKLEDPLSFIPTGKEFGGGGVAFYPDDSKMYYCTQNQIKKIDFTAIQPVSEEIISYDSTYATTLGNMFMAPDSIIYINTQTSGLFIHKLIPKKNPISGKDETFRPKTIKLPVRNTRTLPLSLNYNLGAKYSVSCDSFVSSFHEIQASLLSIYPNPSQSVINIDLSNIIKTGYPEKIQILNSDGQIIYNNLIEKDLLNYSIDIKGWPPGYYVINVSNSKHIYTGKVVIVE